jgi:hypothetical protein
MKGDTQTTAKSLEWARSWDRLFCGLARVGRLAALAGMLSQSRNWQVARAGGGHGGGVQRRRGLPGRSAPARLS